jgi:hypothetical protein
MSAPRPVSAEKSDVLRQVLLLLDMTRDLERNKEDAEFVKAGGTIHYVFDENVFEMAIHPWRWKSRTATFYSSFWLKRARSADRLGWPSIAAQSALIAGEYLLSGALPGQRDSQILMTEWHQWELRDRIDNLVTEQRTLAEEKSISPNTVHDADVFLDRDVRILQSQQRPSKDAVDRFVATRVAANKLARDFVIQPILQLKRITELFSGYIRTLDDLFTVPPTEFDKIAANARAWKNKLLDEQAMPGHRHSLHRLGAIGNDARSLALVQWAADRVVGSNQRVVLVTGDAVNFDAYRRWHAAAVPGTREYIQPFALRRLLQYAPIFNMNDGLGDIAGARQLFELARSAVEVTLLPFNLSQMRGRHDRLEPINRGREYLALKLVELDHTHDLLDNKDIAFFARNLTGEWLQESRDRLDALRVLWQQTERAAIGSMYESISHRFDREQKLLGAELAHLGSGELGPALVDHVGRLLDHIVADSTKLCFPLARRFIKKEISKEFGRNPRPPVLIRLNVPWGDKSIDLRTMLYQWIGGDQHVWDEFPIDDEPDLVGRPDLIFAVAASLALILSAWHDADRFSELAEKSSRARDPSSDEKYELIYLSAIAKRFRLAQISPPSGEDAFAVIVKYWEGASKMLDECIEHHSNRADKSRFELLAQLRGISERAALNLFFGMGCALTTNPRLQKRLFDNRIIARALQDAEQDLASCLTLESQLRRADSENDEDRKVLDRLMRQVFNSIAGCAVFEHVILKGVLPIQFLTPTLIQRMAEHLISEEKTLPEVAVADVKLFLFIAGNIPLMEADQIAQLRQNSNYWRALLLDTARLNAVQRWVAEQSSRESL